MLLYYGLAMLFGRPHFNKRKCFSLMRLFNSFQIVALFAAAPWLLGLLYQQDFPWHTAASVAATVLYGIYTLGMVCLVYLGSRELQ